MQWQSPLASTCTVQRGREVVLLDIWLALEVPSSFWQSPGPFILRLTHLLSHQLAYTMFESISTSCPRKWSYAYVGLCRVVACFANIAHAARNSKFCCLAWLDFCWVWLTLASPSLSGYLKNEVIKLMSQPDTIAGGCYNGLVA